MALRESILESVKDYCMVPQEADIYDGQILEQINSAFFTLFQLGCSVKPYKVEDDSQTWSDFTDNPFLLTIIPDYVQKKVRLGFDPPANSFLVSQLKEDIAQLESRISYTVDPGWEELDE